MFEIKERDAAGRLSILKINNKKIKLPTILPVVNPNKPIITPKELQEKFKIEALITNAYIIYNSSLKEKALDKGIHRLLGFDGVIETDSGSYQMLHYKKSLEVSNKEIVDFQIKIGADIINVLDIPTDIEATFEETEKDLQITLKRIQEGISLKPSNVLMNGAIQGGVYPELRKKAGKLVSALPVDIFAIGTIVPYLINYQFKKLFELILEARVVLPMNKPVHLFGLGHPLVFPLSVAIGTDIFDSASYVLYAYDNRVITPYGTLRLEKAQELLIKTSKRIYEAKELLEMEKEERVRVLAEHNLLTLIDEIFRVRDAIKNHYLWDLVIIKAHSHYKVYEATRFVLKKYYSWLKAFDPVRKSKGITSYSDLLELRSDIRRALERLKERVKKEDIEAIYEYVYPFNSLKDVKPI
jgi:7-cyano-7-deazaguanine tRNA-ribosyltransferase